MIHVTTFFALVVGGMGVIQPAAAGVLAGLSPKINLGLMNTFQRRQGAAPPVPPQCATICGPVNSIISGVSGANFWCYLHLRRQISCGSFKLARPGYAAWPLSKTHTSIASHAPRLQQMWQISLRPRRSSTVSISPLHVAKLTHRWALIFYVHSALRWMRKHRNTASRPHFPWTKS